MLAMTTARRPKGNCTLPNVHSSKFSRSTDRAHTNIGCSPYYLTANDSTKHPLAASTTTFTSACTTPAFPVRGIATPERGRSRQSDPRPSRPGSHQVWLYSIRRPTVAQIAPQQPEPSDPALDILPWRPRGLAPHSRLLEQQPSPQTALHDGSKVRE